MKKIVYVLLLALCLCACGTATENEDKGNKAESEVKDNQTTEKEDGTQEGTTEEGNSGEETTGEGDTNEGDEAVVSGPMTITLAEYMNIPVTNITQEEVDEEIANFMLDFAEMVTVDRAAQEGDTVNINFVGKLDGVAFEGGTDDSEAGTDLVLGSHSFIDGFESGLIGTVAGQVIDLNLNFPDPYENNPDLSGKPVVFTVTVNAVMEEKIPELTDAFIQENTTLTTVDEFNAYMYDLLNKDRIYSQVTAYLITNCKVENPPADLIAQEAEAVVAQYTYYAQYYASMFGMDMETALAYFIGFNSVEELEKYAQEYATYMISYGCILEEIAAKENITLTEEEYQEQGLAYALENNYTDLAEFEAAVTREEIEKAILMDAVLAVLVENVAIQ